jgi:hypothetical protein
MMTNATTEREERERWPNTDPGSKLRFWPGRYPTSMEAAATSTFHVYGYEVAADSFGWPLPPDFYHETADGRRPRKGPSSTVVVVSLASAPQKVSAST